MSLKLICRIKLGIQQNPSDCFQLLNIQEMAFGAAIGMCLPSIAPSTLGKPAKEWKPTKVRVMSLSLLGNFIVFKPMHKALLHHII